MRLEDLPLPQVERLVDRLGDLRHDLGKYIAFESRFVADSASAEDLRTALQSDLLSTRRQGAEVQAAWEVWARLRPEGIDEDPDLRLIESHLARLRAMGLDGSVQELLAARDLAREVSEATRRLHRRALDRLD